MLYSESMTDKELVQLISSNERAILACQAQANKLAIENQQLRRALNQRSMLKGFPVGQMVVIVGGAKG